MRLSVCARSPAREVMPAHAHGEEGGGGGGGGGGGWARRWWRALAAECLGTALLVVLGCASLMPGHVLTHPALAFAGAVTFLVAALGPASGAHFNPAVTLAALLCGQLAAAPALAYLVAQVVGGAAGAGCLALLGGPKGATVTHAHVPAAAAVAVEALLTGSLVLLACSLWRAHDPLAPDHAAPLKLGLTVAGLVYSGGPLTGASLNPARSFGPALVHNDWADQWVYWAGPLLGGAAAALLHRALVPPAAPAGPRTAPAAPEEVPLQLKGGGDGGGEV